jgi:hypothetical protein
LEEFEGEWLPVTWLIGPNKATRNLGMAHIAVCAIAPAFHDFLLTLLCSMGTRLRSTRSTLMPRSSSASQRLIILFASHLRLLLTRLHVSRLKRSMIDSQQKRWINRTWLELSGLVTDASALAS